LLLLDVDRFKQINDRYGHVVGDEVLAAIGALLRSEARTVDIVGRTGGDEFAVLLPETPGDRAAALAQRVSSSATSLDVAAPVAVSVGLAAVGTAVPVPADPRDLVRIADRSLYDAKRRRTRAAAKVD
jgi:diguanylate cyclase (GGDEF)-like protein